MNRKAEASRRILDEMMEMATELNSHGLLSKAEMAELKVLCQEPPQYTSENVVSIRTKRARMSQAVFASFLNVSVSTVQKWEAPASGKRPSGAAAKLLQLIDKKGIEAVLV